jgi:hypothetical protein
MGRGDKVKMAGAHSANIRADADNIIVSLQLWPETNSLLAKQLG